MTKLQSGADFLQRLHREIPLTTHMGLCVPEWDGHCLKMPAALAPNVNDKGTGFGGSQATLATLCGWSITTLWLEQQGKAYDVVVRDSQMEYLQPVIGDFYAITCLPDAETLHSFLARLQTHGRARLPLQIEIRQQDKVALRMSGQYVALEKAPIPEKGGTA